jgi:hypothetical protein
VQGAGGRIDYGAGNHTSSGQRQPSSTQRLLLQYFWRGTHRIIEYHSDKLCTIVKLTPAMVVSSGGLFASLINDEVYWLSELFVLSLAAYFVFAERMHI